MKTHKCNQCKRTKELNFYNFGKDNRAKSGYKSNCRECEKKASRNNYYKAKRLRLKNKTFRRLGVEHNLKSTELPGKQLEMTKYERRLLLAKVYKLSIDKAADIKQIDYLCGKFIH